jgi:hypothetical protein
MLYWPLRAKDLRSGNVQTGGSDGQHQDDALAVSLKILLDPTRVSSSFASLPVIPAHGEFLRPLTVNRVVISGAILTANVTRLETSLSLSIFSSATAKPKIVSGRFIRWTLVIGRQGPTIW